MKPHFIEPVTHTVWYIDRFGREIRRAFTHREYDIALPELLESGQSHGIVYHVTAGGETRTLDYYNTYK